MLHSSLRSLAKGLGSNPTGLRDTRVPSVTINRIAIHQYLLAARLKAQHPDNNCMPHTKPPTKPSKEVCTLFRCLFRDQMTPGDH